MIKRLIFISIIGLCYCHGSNKDRMHPRSRILDENRKIDNNQDAKYWNKKASDELRASLNKYDNLNTNVAKNIIIFIGDGMSLPTLSAARIYKTQKARKNGKLKNITGEEILLAMESLPHMGLSRTYDTDYQTPDSAATASSIMTGVKTKSGMVGFDDTAKRADPDSQINEIGKVSSIMSWAQEAGKDTGFVTTTRVSHATPSSTYAHIVERDWECDREVAYDVKDKEKLKKINDITKQLVMSDPGRKAKVVMGGGKRSWIPKPPNEPKPRFDYDSDHFDCYRLDELNLIDEFLNKSALVPGFEGTTGKLLSNYSDVKALLDDIDSADYVLGLFEWSHMLYDHQINLTKEDRSPTLPEMTELAIKMLQKNDNGFFLLVEGGKIDHAHHGGRAGEALDETVALDHSIEIALNLTDDKDTLIIVTADHGHTLTLSGYAPRDMDILGYASDDRHDKGDDKLPLSIMSYANGKGFKDHTFAENNKIRRKDISKLEFDDLDYRVPSTVLKNSETHSGADVGIFASGPWAHLFNSVHEQNYINHVMAFSGCLQKYKDEKHCTNINNKGGHNKENKSEYSNNEGHKLVSFNLLMTITYLILNYIIL